MCVTKKQKKITIYSFLSGDSFHSSPITDPPLLSPTSHAILLTHLSAALPPAAPPLLTITAAQLTIQQPSQ
jgi:hypothetical protein